LRLKAKAHRRASWWVGSVYLPGRVSPLPTIASASDAELRGSARELEAEIDRLQYRQLAVLAELNSQPQRNYLHHPELLLTEKPEPN
jgi:hypothetical protein